MIELKLTRNDLGLYQADAVLTLPPLCITVQKADRDDLEYELRNVFENLVGEIVGKQLKEEF